ncbi:MAG: response regulator transcription factor [Saprospiraceae bacterium]|nr:response regulator transcription factor [Saprospiraceae bacterium]MCB9324411.1 response regulator transcription factor [Lewinellaceae bacterium]
MKANIFYVEDDQSLSFVTRDNLEFHGFNITHCADGNEALDIVRKEKFDLYILDVMLPGVDGFTIAEEVRKYDKEAPILFLTAKSMKEDKIYGLRLGADDYITKPFSIEELILKIEIFLRRSKVHTPPSSDHYQIGSYLFDYPNLCLILEGKEKRLTQKEADLLRFFLDNRGKILKRSEILEKIWGRDDYFLGRSLDVFISRLRKYLNADPEIKIENIHGVGFRFS